MEAYHSGSKAAQGVGAALQAYVGPLLERLDEVLDKRLVRTLCRLLLAMLVHRHREHGLLLSELGGYVAGDEHAPAGTKRISNLLRSRKWSHQVIDEELWCQADAKVAEIEQSGQRAFVLWDESVAEKNESQANPDLCAVRSSKAARKLSRKPGFPRPPLTRPVFVPGLNVHALMVVGLKDNPVLANLTFWTRRGEHATQRGDVGAALFAQCNARWSKRVIHVCDRGYASATWVGRFVAAKADFVLRWNSRYNLVDAQGERLPGRMSQNKRSVDSQPIYDPRHQVMRRVGIVFFPVTHPKYPASPLWLVVARPKGRDPWLLLTTLPITSIEEAWTIIFTYMRRWQVETAFRFLKSELALESPRLWLWENRLKLLAIVALLYSFLVSLLLTAYHQLRSYLLDHWCRRTGTWKHLTAMPLYRLRSAISRLLLSHPLLPDWKNSG